MNKKYPKNYLTWRLTAFDQQKNQQPTVDNIRDLSDLEQAEVIASQFAEIQNQYDPLNADDISVPAFNASDIPQVKISQVWAALRKI